MNVAVTVGKNATVLLNSAQAHAVKLGQAMLIGQRFDVHIGRDSKPLSRLRGVGHRCIRYLQHIPFC